MPNRKISRARHRADVRPTTFLSTLPSSSVVRRSTIGIATAGLAFGLVAPSATASDPGPAPESSTDTTATETSSQPESTNTTEQTSNSGSSNSSSETTHTVAAGDTVGQIASQYGTSISAIGDANGINVDLIYPGDVLTIPGASGSSSSQNSGSSNSGSSNSNSGAQQASTTSMSGSSTSSHSNAILQEARKHIGTPYVWGGATPGAFDCSGFTQYVFAQVGIDLPRNSGAQRNAGQVISQSEAQPGDLVWWPGHVGIYTGDGQHIAARNPSTPLQEGPIHQANPTFIRVS